MSLRFQADNDLNFVIVKAVRRREPAIDFASAHESGLDGISDPEVLERAASDGRILVSHDVHTMLGHFRDYLTAGKSSPGILIASQSASVADVVESIVTIWAVSDLRELRDQAFHIPSLIGHNYPR